MIARRICPFCEACCGLELELAGDPHTAVRGRAADVFSHGILCPTGAALADLHADPDRLRAPLVKRDGRFVETSWDEAFAEIERRLPPILDAHGKDAVAITLGNPSAHKFGLLLYGARLARALGTANVYSASTLDQMPKQLSAGLMFGHWLSVPVPDIERTELLVIIGGNPMVSNGSMWTVPDFRGKARALRARGGKIVVVDPRRSETAAIADAHHFIRPGGDAFFLAGIVQTLFAEDLVKLGRLAPHLAGLAELRAAIARFSPEARGPALRHRSVRDPTLARQLATTERAAVYGRIGTCTQTFGTLASWLVDVVNVLTGHLDEPGGAMFPKAAAFAANTLGPPGKGKGIAIGRRRSRVSSAPEVFGEFPMTCLAEEIETPGDGQVRALIAVGTNPVLSAPNGARLAAAMAKLVLVVSIDIYRNETTRLADVILPGCSPLEDSHFDVAFPQLAYKNAARYSPALLPRDRPAEWEILLRLIAIAQRRAFEGLDDALTADDVRRVAGPMTELVLAQVAKWTGPERLLDLALRAGPYKLTLDQLIAAPDGIDLGPLAPRIPEMLRTPTGMVASSRPRCSSRDLDRAAADLARPVPDLVIIGRRQLRSNNSWMHNLPGLASGKFRCTALVHPADAQRLGLAHGGRATIRSATGEIAVEVELSDAMMPGVVSVPHGWGHDQPGAQLATAAERPGANLNAVLGDVERDPLSGNAVLSGVAIAMTPA